MKVREENINELVELYLQGKLKEQELNDIFQQLDEHPKLKKEWEESIEILGLLEERASYVQIKDKIKSAGEKNAQNIQPTTLKKSRPYWKLGIAAALLILLSSSITIFILKNERAQTGTAYMLLRREVETIKKSQNQLFDSIKTTHTNELEQNPVYSGTGFAISANGFIATNYHVVKDAQMIYVEDANKEIWKAYLVAFEANSDLAILKIEDHDYKLNSSSLPYSLSAKNSNLGQSIFSLGFPQENLVYHEGYISSEQGFDGNMSSYQLEMTSNPGQSGAPVIDHHGNIIAVITGKQSNTSGRTYAINSLSLIDLIESLPEETRLSIKSNKNTKGLDRAQQVNKIREFIYAVSVK